MQKPTSCFDTDVISYALKILNISCCRNSNRYQVNKCDKIFGIGRIYNSKNTININDYFNQHLLYLLDTFLITGYKQIVRICDPNDFRGNSWKIFNDMLIQKLYNIGIIYNSDCEKCYFYSNDISESILYVCENIDAKLYDKYKVLINEEDKYLFEVYEESIEIGLL
jgi:hypothetical protein